MGNTYSRLQRLGGSPSLQYEKMKRLRQMYTACNHGTNVMVPVWHAKGGSRDWYSLFEIRQRMLRSLRKLVAIPIILYMGKEIEAN